MLQNEMKDIFRVFTISKVLSQIELSIDFLQIQYSQVVLLQKHMNPQIFLFHSNFMNHVGCHMKNIYKKYNSLTLLLFT